MLEYFCKQSRESLDYTIDFSRFLVGREYINLSSAVITAPVVNDAAATLVITRVGYTKNQVAIWLAGGEDGVQYTVIVTIGTDQGRQKEQQFLVKTAGAGVAVPIVDIADTTATIGYQQNALPMGAGASLSRFTVTLSTASVEPVAVDWSTSDGTAQADIDYPLTTGTVIFAPGETAKTLDVFVYGRTVGNEDRSFFVELMPPANAILGDAQGECVIHVNTSGTLPVTQLIVPTGPRGYNGKSAYQVWLDLGNTGTEQDFIDSLKPSAEEIAEEVAPLLNVGNAPVTAQGTEALSKPDTTTVKGLARRIAYIGATKVATVVLAEGDNLIGQSDLTGDTIEFFNAGLYPRIMRGSTVITPQWSIEVDGRLLVKAASAGDQLYVCQYDFISGRKTNTNSRELWRRSLVEMGLDLVDGSFEEGARLEEATDVVLQDSTGLVFVWEGTLPKDVPSKSTPVSTGGEVAGAWKRRNDVSLRKYVDDKRYVTPRFETATGTFATGGSASFNKSAMLNEADGMFYSPRAGTINVVGGTLPDASWICVGNATMSQYQHTLFDFGCKDDNGVTDNRAKIQLAVEFMEFFKSKLYTDSSKDDAYFGVATFDPSNAGNCITLRSPRNLYIEGGRTRNASIKYTGMLPGNALFSLKTPAHDFGGVIIDLGASASNTLDFVLDGHDQWYANMRIVGGCYQEAHLDNIHLSCYMTTFDRVFSNVCGRRGFAFGGPDSSGGWAASTSTSINLDNCWARLPGETGFHVANELWYSNWKSIGVDGGSTAKVPLAYHIQQAKGVSLSGIGAEQIEKILYVGTFRGLTITGIQSSGAGPATGTADCCIELVGGTDATISGFAPRDAFDSKFTSILKISGPTGNEFVNILDQSITGSKITVVKGGGFYKYPDVVYFSASDSRDSGFLRASKVLFPGKDFGVFCGNTKEADTIFSRTFTLTTADIISTQYLSVADATAASDYNAEVEVTCHEEGVAPVRVTAYIVRRSGVSTMTLLSGTFPTAWRLDVFQTVARVITTTATKKTFIVRVNLVSPTAVITFKL